jgi:hypothetical protein
MQSIHLACLALVDAQRCSLKRKLNKHKVKTLKNSQKPWVALEKTSVVFMKRLFKAIFKLVWRLHDNISNT